MKVGDCCGCSRGCLLVDVAANSNVYVCCVIVLVAVGLCVCWWWWLLLLVVVLVVVVLMMLLLLVVFIVGVCGLIIYSIVVIGIICALCVI
jgi:hypothetical protein